MSPAQLEELKVLTQLVDTLTRLREADPNEANEKLLEKVTKKISTLLG